MEFITGFWLPILLSGVVLFFASFVSWTMAPHHRTDWKRVDNEDQLMKSIGDLNLPPGNYLFPFATHDKQSQAAARQKYEQGPRGILTLWSIPNMGANMACTFVFFLITSAVIGFVGYIAMGTGIPFAKVLTVLALVGVLTYSAAGIPNAIWFKRRLRSDLIDGVVYGLVVGLIFAIFWPAA